MVATLKPHIQLVCPVCFVPLAFDLTTTGNQSIAFVLTPRSQAHLDGHR